MKTYNGLDNKLCKHKIKVTLQHEEYKGSFICTTSGNCMGFETIHNVCSNLDSGYLEKNCIMKKCKINTLETIDEETYYLVTLTNENGEELELELNLLELESCIVAAEIVAFQEGL